MNFAGTCLCLSPCVCIMLCTGSEPLFKKIDKPQMPQVRDSFRSTAKSRPKAKIDRCHVSATWLPRVCHVSEHTTAHCPPPPPQVVLGVRRILLRGRLIASDAWRCSRDEPRSNGCQKRRILYLKHDLCIKDEEFCIKNNEFCI